MGVTIKFKNHTLPSSSLFDFPTQNASSTVGHSVSVQGSTITLKFTSDKIAKVKDILSGKSSKPRYVKILTKDKRIFVSPTPFSSPEEKTVLTDQPNGKFGGESMNPSCKTKSTSSGLSNGKFSGAESTKIKLKGDKSKEQSIESPSESEEKKPRLKIPIKRELKQPERLLSEPVSKPVER